MQANKIQNTIELCNKLVGNTIGIDEAGRGPVLGSMFIAAVKNVSKPYRDSKTLTKYGIRKMAAEIMETYAYKIIEVTPYEIDRENLNELTARIFKELILAFEPELAYVDCCWPDCNKLSKYLQKDTDCKVICEHKADTRYWCVAAASILAKNAREEHVSELHKKIGFFGSGYPSDPITKEFIKTMNPSCEYIRKKWVLK